MANVYQSVLDAGGSAPTSITPSNSSPAFMSSGGTYQPTANGYAIESYSSKTPSDSTPPSVSSGDIVKMGGAGYLYATQQGETETTLWTNPNPTVTFSAQEVTLSDSIANYKYIEFEWQQTSSVATKAKIRMLTTDFAVDRLTAGPKVALGARSGTTFYTRICAYLTNTTIRFDNCTSTSGTSASTGCIPTKVIGIN